MRILVVEDEQAMNSLLAKQLRAAHYSVDACFTGTDALDHLLGAEYDALVLDIMLPGVSGLEVLRRMRAKGDRTPVLLLTAKDGVEDRVTGLDAGADDYLTKPFSIEELLARLRVTQRRLLLLQASGDADSPVFQNGKLKIDYAAGCAYLNGEELHLTPIEYKLLCLLSHNVGKVLTHTYITQQIWGSSWENDIASLRVFMATLRKKLEPKKDCPQYIQTHIGVGYRMLRVD